ncbi:hypothetical protein D9757_008286 [Collybiopsis confluens]|uniref:RRM domain-containing protein n=1 Tax=Collybiopsis confluens TaxID=2823264 RepID=A0A8H5H4D2_9AGAR|nr:hypothetical protein D9757_008286 [Collybiopsis confluens]
MDNREWDRGKFNEPRQNYHPRDQDDHYSQGKRRKFNDGGYQGYDPSQALDEYSQDHSQGQQARGPAGGYPKKRLQPSEPSPHVIFLGLDPDFTESDVCYPLSNVLHWLNMIIYPVTIIPKLSWMQCGIRYNHPRKINRQLPIRIFCFLHALTLYISLRLDYQGSSKGFGFAQFSSSEHARAFVDPLFPFVQVPPPASHGATATAAFYKSLETGTPHNGRRVKIDYSQSATPHEKGRSKGNTNDGTRDIGNAQAPVLLFRGLDPLSGPQAIHQAMKSSSGHGKEGANGMKRIILIKDKVTLASFGFAFVEFVDIPSASAVLAVTMSPQVHPAGFRISDRPVAASFAHPDSFQPIQERMLRDEACLASSLALGGAEGTWVRYWDETSTVAVIEFQAAAPQLSTTSTAKDKKDKKKKEHTLKTFAPPVASALPVSDKPVTLSFNKGPAKTNNALGPAVKPLALGFSADDANEESDDAEDGSKVNNPKGVAPLIASKKTINNINKWNQVQEELSGNTPVKTSSTLVIYPFLA